MAHRGPPRAPKGPGPAARAPSPRGPPPPRSPRSRPLLLLLLLLAACGAAGRSPESWRLGPRARLTRAPPSPPAGRALPGGGEDRQARGAEPDAPGPGPAPGPGEDDAPAAGQERWARAAPVAGAASRAQVSLISTSFVLKGDATHNQAMVHWTGENSSVSDLRAPPPTPGPAPDTSEPPLPDGPAVTPGILGDLGTRVTSAAPLLAPGHWLLGNQIRERPASPRGAFPLIARTLSHLRGGPTGLQIAGWGGCLRRFRDPGHLGAPPGPLRSLTTRCCASIAFRLHPVHPALLWDFWFQDPLHLVYPGPRSWHLHGL